MRPKGCSWATLVLLISVTAIAGARGFGGASHAAEQLVSLMQAQKLDAFAAEDPERRGRFIAAMLVSDIQLLVVAAETTSPAYLTSQLSERNYRNVYTMLHATAVQPTKLFVQDMGCDGLKDEGETVDIVYERAATQMVFDGDWKRQNLSKAEYRENLQKADGAYSQMLTVLINALRASGQSSDATVDGS